MSAKGENKMKTNELPKEYIEVLEMINPDFAAHYNHKNVMEDIQNGKTKN